MAQAVTHDTIREMAYQLWLDAGQPDGQDQENWFQAEASLSTPKPRRKAAARAAALVKATSAKKSAAHEVVA